jgi:peptidoglycan/xylan/chitin deacetylase (PgdA/CDA1 family)
MAIAVFHHIGEPTEDKFTHSLEQITQFKGLVTFDGAYKEVYTNREVLSKLHPILFVQWNTIGKKGVCNLSEIADLANLGFRIGWHGRTHRPLTELTDDEVREELRSELGKLLYYAYPHGEYDERTKQLVRKAGYKIAYSTTQGDDTDMAKVRLYI